MKHRDYYVCKNCGKRFNPREISGNNGEVLKCDECGGQLKLEKCKAVSFSNDSQGNPICNSCGATEILYDTFAC